MFFVCFFSVRLLSVLRGHSGFLSPPQRPMTFDFEGFLHQILSITLFCLSLFLRKSQYFSFQCWVLNKGTTGTIFITSLLWRGPWLGIEPGTSRTRCQHSTTRLSRRRLKLIELSVILVLIYQYYHHRNISEMYLSLQIRHNL